MNKEQVVVPKSWSSEFTTLTAFVLLSFLSIYLTETNSWSVVHGVLFTIGDSRIMLTLPLFWFLPAGAACTAIYRVYNVRYAMDKRGIEAKVGILGPWQSVTRIRFEDIRGVEFRQSILGRILNFGSVEIGTAATSDVEVAFHGVAAPNEIQQLIQRERDARIKLATQTLHPTTEQQQGTAHAG